MKRRDFFKKGTQGAFAASVFPVIGSNSEKDLSDRIDDKWESLGTGRMEIPAREKTVFYDVVVVGGGMAGISAAVSAARNGAQTVLIQDRPVLGGNGSSEIRVNVNGVLYLKNGKPERETGIIEEILLENRFSNQQESYPVWDHVMYDYVTREENIDLMLNTQAVDVEMSGTRIVSVTCWQSTTETVFTVNAKIFIDCSGDGLMAAKAGALYRTGREAKDEFNEKFAPEKADGWQMGASLTLQGKDMGRPMPYIPPSFTIKYDGDNANDRRINNFMDGYWWVELGSDYDNIADFEKNRHRLMGYLHGVWDYIKNSGKYPESENYALAWVASIPGRRESRRFIGDYILCEGDLLEHRHFYDAVAYGGWPIDEHCPGGIDNLKEKPTIFHHRFEKIYEIPFRSLYSRNVSNLLFAGRNISQTHIALSSTRVQATCAIMGQAVGTASAICIKNSLSPRELAKEKMNELQERLLRDDAFIPKRPAKDPKDLARTANLIFASSTTSGDVKLLTDGMSRDVDGEIHHWQSDGLPAEVQLEWEKPVSLSKLELKCDTNVHVNITMRKDERENEEFRRTIPPEMMKALEIEARVNGKWISVGKLDNNRTRLIRFHFDTQTATAVRIKLKATYGLENGRLYEIRCYS